MTVKAEKKLTEALVTYLEEDLKVFKTLTTQNKETLIALQEHLKHSKDSQDLLKDEMKGLRMAIGDLPKQAKEVFATREEVTIIRETVKLLKSIVFGMCGGALITLLGVLLRSVIPGA